MMHYWCIYWTVDVDKENAHLSATEKVLSWKSMLFWKSKKYNNAMTKDR